ncbi:2-phosphosulfolactate phosphatase [Candidatus Bathyarchaeota archaeon]|nr:2-phosphosulfolactate phosphatase [Candidatus Bathyarchaeota archaeon]
MSIKVNVDFLAKDAIKAVKRGDVIIVVDVLRCSSTIITALANGAKAIIPVKTLSEARRIRSKNPDYLLAGERGGLKPRGFELGNSPLEYIPERVSGRTIILTTTSGTRALTYSTGVGWILVGALLNAKSAAERAVALAEEEGVGISIVQSGTNGMFSLEDFMGSGAIIDRILKEGLDLTDSAHAALLAFKQSEKDLYNNLLKSSHSKRLMKIGFGKDIKFSSQLDIFSITPIYKNGVIKGG